MRPAKRQIVWISNKDLGIDRPGGHSCVVTSVNRKRRTARVKTITSLEHLFNGVMKWDFKSLSKARKGELLPIPKDALRSHHYSGIDHRAKTVRWTDIRQNTKSYRYPMRYDKLIMRK